MKIEFLQKFSKDIDQIKDQSVKLAIFRIIRKAEASKSFSEIPNTQKLSGFKSAYRIRVGHYRIGVFVEAGTLSLQGLHIERIFIEFFLSRFNLILYFKIINSLE